MGLGEKMKCQNCIHWLFKNKNMGVCTKVNGGKFFNPVKKQKMEILSLKDFVCKWWAQK